MSGVKKICMMANMAEEEKIILPEGYVECEFLSANGYSRLKTPHPGDGVIVESILQGNNTTTSYKVPFSVYKNQGGYSVYHYAKGWTLGSSLGYLPYTSEIVRIRITFANQQASLSMNNSLDGKYSEPQVRTGNSSYIPHNLYIFGADTNSNAFHGCIYWVKVYDLKNNLLSHYIPAYRLSDNKPGMYDVIREEFLTNVGTSEFSYRFKQ